MNRFSGRVVVLSLAVIILSSGRAWSASSDSDIRMFYTTGSLPAFNRESPPPPRLVLADEKGVEVKAVEGSSMYEQWSPDGERIFVELKDDEGYGDDVMAVMGLDLKLIQVKGQIPHKAFYKPTWSADGKHIVYVGMTEGIATVGVDDTSSSIVCSEDKDIAFSGVFPSPDGKKLAVSGYAKPYVSGRQDDVFMTEADCSKPVRLTTDAPGGTDLRWSRDGKRIAMVTQTEGITDNKILIMDADGQNRREFKEGYHVSVSWTDDGRLLTTWQDVSTPEASRMCFLGIIDPATGLATVLCKGVNMYFGSAEWRPRKA